MNKQRRKELNAVKVGLQVALSALETIRDEEREYFDSMPEGVAESERGEAASLAADSLDSAVDEVESAIGLIEEAVGE